MADPAVSGAGDAEALPEGFDYRPGWLGDADGLFRTLRSDLDWREQEIHLFGRRVMQPRLMDWYADPGVRYRYSGLTLEPREWPPALDLVRQTLNRQFGRDFNSVLCNAYRGGEDSMGWHADDERELGQQPVIASLSLGSVRRFRIRPRGGGRSLALDLGHGSLLLMKGCSQVRYQHSIPKTRKPVGLRINLTFREVLGPR